MKQYRLIFCSVCFIYLCRIVASQGFADDLNKLKNLPGGFGKDFEKIGNEIKKKQSKMASRVVNGVGDILPNGDSSNDAKTEVTKCLSKISSDLYSKKSNAAKTCQVRSEYLKCYKQVYDSKLTKEILAKLKGRIDSLLEKDGFKSCAVHEKASAGAAESSTSLFIVALTAVVQCLVYVAL